MTAAHVRTLALAAGTGALLLGVAGCAGSLPADEIGSTIVTQLKGQGVTVDGDRVSCPGDVPVDVGRTVVCGFTAGGQPVDAVARVSSVEGPTVNVDVSTAARPVPKAVLETAVTRQLGHGGVPAERTSCDGDLPPRVGRTQTCTASGGGGTLPLTTTVTAVRGGLVSFSIGKR
ncbi:MAG: DUF4333 domain-containing protein [Actinomycetota bacterium]|nr:DUF4333 domain-containing protein [Actinomycetota bacterium]